MNNKTLDSLIENKASNKFRRINLDMLLSSTSLIRSSKESNGITILDFFLMKILYLSIV